MLSYEPEIKVALLQNYKEARLNLNGSFILSDEQKISGHIIVMARQGEAAIGDPYGRVIASGKK